MKKLLLATAVAALSVSAQAAPTVYGKAFLTVDYNDADKTTKLSSQASRVGFKGSENLTANTDVVYQLEYGVKVDDSSSQFTSRDTYIGLANKQYGTLLAGRLTTIDDHINYAKVTQGGVLGGNAVRASFDGPRVDNAFAYVSPSYSGLNFLAMYALDADQDAAPNGLSDAGWGVGAKYEPAGQPFRAGATYIQSGELKAARVSGAFDVNKAITLGALYQNTDGLGEKKENLLTVSGKMKTATPWVPYAQVDFTQNVKGSDVDHTRVAVGGQYEFNKSVIGHAYVAGLDDGSDTNFGLGTGIEYKF